MLHTDGTNKDVDKMGSVAQFCQFHWTQSNVNNRGLYRANSDFGWRKLGGAGR